MPHTEIDRLATAIREGSVPALARGLTWVEAGGDRAQALTEALYPYTRPAHVIGITGAPGAGKSTLVRALVQEARRRQLAVGVLAVDPSSPFTGGAILGDRIRMNDVVNDPGVFIRSMATRGALGGLCRAAADAIDLYCASDRRLVLVETVGVGQDEVDIMRVAHTTIVVSVPGLGDDIQALKAGIVEIADIHAVNKADRDGADRTIAELRTMLSMTKMPAGWQVPVVRCVAARDEGIAALLDQAFMHLEFLQQSGALEARERRMAEARVTTLAHSLISATLKAPDPKGGRSYEEDIAKVARREWSPYRCATAAIARASGIEKERTYV